MIIGMIVLAAALLLALLWGLLESGDRKHWQKVSARLIETEACYLKQIGDNREEADELRREKRYLEMKVANADLALAEADKNAREIEEHLGHYMDALAASERMRGEEEPPDEWARGCEREYLTNKIELLRKLLVGEMFKNRDQAKQIAELEKHVFDHMTMSPIPHFAQGDDAYDPKHVTDRKASENQ